MDSPTILHYLTIFQASFVFHLSLPYRYQLTVNMNGLRALARKEETRFTFPPDTRYNNATTIEVRPDLYEPGVSHWRTQYAVDDLLLAKFLERGGPAFSTPGNEDQGENKCTNYGTKLVILAATTKNKANIFMKESIFQDLVKTLNPDPLFNRIFHVRYYPFFEFSGSIANGGIATIKLSIKASTFLFMLSIRQHDEDPAFDSRCVALRVVQGVGPPQLVEADHLFDCLEDLKEEARSPLYLPFALSVYAVHACHDSLTAIHWCVSLASTTTSDGLFGKTYGLGNGTPIDRNRVVKESRSIGIALSNAAFVTSTLNGVESLWQYLEAMAEEISPSAKTEQVVQSTNNLLEAIRFLRQEVKCMRETVRYGEVSIRNHASLVSFLYMPVLTCPKTACL